MLLSDTHTTNKRVRGKFLKWCIGLWQGLWWWFHGWILMSQIMKWHTLYTAFCMAKKKKSHRPTLLKMEFLFFFNFKNRESYSCSKSTDQCILQAAEIGRMGCVCLNRHMSIFSLIFFLGHMCTIDSIRWCLINILLPRFWELYNISYYCYYEFLDIEYLCLKVQRTG